MNYLKHLNQYRIERLINPISSNAIALYFVLMEYNNMLGWIKTFTAPNTVLQGLSSLTRNSLHLARNELKQKGYIKYDKGSGNQCGKYLLVRFNTQRDTQTDTQRDTQAQHSVGPLTKPNETKLNIPPNPQGGSDGFELFWKAYPKKHGKADALKKFAKLKASDELIGQMLEAIKKQSATEQWQKDSGQFIPNPATWINQQRWLDEVETENRWEVLK